MRSLLYAPHALLAASAVATILACNSTPPPTTTAPVTPVTDPRPGATARSGAGGDDDVLPPAARALAKDELEGDKTCGPWSTKDLAKAESALLEDRVRVRFFAGAAPQGGKESGKLEVQKNGETLFVGARETFQRGDDLFDRRAAKAAAFGGDYEPVAVPGKDGKLTIVTGVKKELGTPKGDLVAIAHGWFLDPNRDVLDVAVFVSAGALGTDFAKCRLFAEKILGTVSQGPRMLAYAKGVADIDTQVSYAKFTYRPGPDWVLTDAMGIHDFARMHFRKRGVFPHEITELQMALDSHPGDWKSDGDPEGDREGKLLGLAVTWHLTKDTSGSRPLYGAWARSTALVHNDHAVASLFTSSAADRDEAIRFAESIRAGR